MLFSQECNSVCGMMETSFYHPGAPATPISGMTPVGFNTLNQSSSSYSKFMGSFTGQSPSISPMRNFSGRISSPGLPNLARPSASPALGNMGGIRYKSKYGFCIKQLVIC